MSLSTWKKVCNKFLMIFQDTIVTQTEEYLSNAEYMKLQWGCKVKIKKTKNKKITFVWVSN